MQKQRNYLKVNKEKKKRLAELEKKISKNKILERSGPFISCITPIA